MVMWIFKEISQLFPEEVHSKQQSQGLMWRGDRRRRQPRVDEGSAVCVRETSHPQKVEQTDTSPSPCLQNVIGPDELQGELPSFFKLKALQRGCSTRWHSHFSKILYLPRAPSMIFNRKTNRNTQKITEHFKNDWLQKMTLKISALK